MSRQFEEKVVLVTGGGSGIGQVTSLQFAKEGAKVVIADISVDGGQETVHQIKGIKGDAIFVKTDLTKDADVQALINKTVETYGKLDCAFNNAGVCIRGKTADCTEAEWETQINVNLKSVWLCMKYEIRQMLKQGGGVIVNTASVSGLVGTIGTAAYCAAKGGVVLLTKSAALEYAKEGIRINCVCPGATRTAMIEKGIRDRIAEGNLQAEEWLLALHPVGRLGKPEEIAAAVLFLCSDGASFVHGHAMCVDGGLTAR